MATILEFQQRAKNVKPSQVKRDLFRYIKSIENEFVNLNIKQLEQGIDAEGKTLKNTNKKYSGIYTKATEEIAKLENPLAPKKAGELYNFLWYGDLFKGFELFVKTGNLELFSTGTGTDEKAAFFDGYKDLFGLTDENLRIEIDTRLIPNLQEYYRFRLGL
jgi:hypothetical protein